MHSFHSASSRPFAVVHRRQRSDEIPFGQAVDRYFAGNTSRVIAWLLATAYFFGIAMSSRDLLYLLVEMEQADLRLDAGRAAMKRIGTGLLASARSPASPDVRPSAQRAARSERRDLRRRDQRRL